MSQLIKIKVKPRSARPGVAAEGDQLMVRVKAPPENGKANREVLKLLADFFAISRGEIEIKSGFRSNVKWLLIPDQIHINRYLGGMHE
jgi:hypothetical protein